LCEHEPVSVQINHVELHHAVFLRRQRARYFDTRPPRKLLVERLHIVGDDVDVPGVAFTAARIVRSDVV